MMNFYRGLLSIFDSSKKIFIKTIAITNALKFFKIFQQNFGDFDPLNIVGVVVFRADAFGKLF